MTGTFYPPDDLKAIAMALMLLQAFACGIWFHSLWIKGGRP
jgi:hypothetical protein